MNVQGVSLGSARCALDIGDGSERGEHVCQDYILERLGRPHRNVGLMHCYYPLDEGWPRRASELAGPSHRGNAWGYAYKDVKIQVEFNPALVGAYRLIGYENRILAHRDFNDDTRDAGDIGAGHTVTALYEIVPAATPVNIPGIDPLKYQSAARLSEAAGTGELMHVKLRYKEPDGDASTLLQLPVTDQGLKLSAASRDFHFAAAVAAYGLVLRKSKYMGSASLDLAEELAIGGRGGDDHGYRAEFIALVGKAKALPR